MREVELAGTKFVIRELEETDLERAPMFLEFICSLIDDPRAMILLKDKPDLELEKGFLAGALYGLRQRKWLIVLAESGGHLTGMTNLQVQPGRQDHVAELGIAIAGEENRGIGLGSVLLEHLIARAPQALEPPPRMLRLRAFGGNERALGIYKRFGFVEVARVPEQLEFGGIYHDEVIMLRQP